MPITMYEIKKAQKTLNTDKLRATDFLVMEKLKDSEIKRLNIETTDSQVDSQISEIAKQNGISLDKFYAAVAQQGMSLDEYRAKLKEQMLTQELVRKILFSSNVGQEDELRKYYNQHQHEFVIAKQMDMTRFVSNDKQTLEDFIKSNNPDKEDSNISREDSIVKMEELPTQIVDLLSATKEHSFTQVLQAGNGSYVTFYIKKKIDTELVDFDKAKGYIAQKLMAENQEKILNEYFERVRTNAKIEFIR